ncbi:hypothetical protein AB3Y40_09850 [Yoonia sp. R2331]|uniref:hypothetical protein n=1 Tax=Yoonia sp. R2331 TaxID=3237238 RepID=UPI0034E562A0
MIYLHAFFIILLLVLFLYGVPKLLFRKRRHARLITKLARDNGWEIDRTPRDVLPSQLSGETLHNIGNPSDYYSFRVWLTIKGEIRGRDFLLVAHGKQKTRTRDPGSGSVHIFTKLSKTPIFPPLFIHLKSNMLDGLLDIDASALATVKKRTAPHFPKVGMPKPFSDTYTVRGLTGAQDAISEKVQSSLLDAPHLFYRKSEKWHMRTGSMLGLTERFAFIEIQDLNLYTLENRLNALMDWVEILDTNRET